MFLNSLAVHAVVRDLLRVRACIHEWSDEERGLQLS